MEEYMTQPPVSSFAEPGARTRALQQAIDQAGDERSATLGVTDSVEPGDFEFTFMFRAEAEGDFVAFDISIIWDGGSHATWSLDISEHEAISMASSAPIYGCASWRNGDDLLLAYQSDDFLEVEGWARVPGAAPGCGHKDLAAALAESQTWIHFARTITAVVQEVELPGMTGRRFD
jgi:hypothetical protein